MKKQDRIDQLLDVGYNLLVENGKLVRHPSSLTAIEVAKAIDVQPPIIRWAFGSHPKYIEQLISRISSGPTPVTVPQFDEFLLKEAVQLTELPDGRRRHPDSLLADQIKTHLDIGNTVFTNAFGTVANFRKRLFALITNDGKTEITFAEEFSSTTVRADKKVQGIETRAAFIQAGLELLEGKGANIENLRQKDLVESPVGRSMGSFVHHWPRFEEYLADLRDALFSFHNTTRPNVNPEYSPTEDAEAVYAYFRFLGFKNSTELKAEDGSELTAEELDERLSDRIDELTEAENVSDRDYLAIFELNAEIGMIHGQLLDQRGGSVELHVPESFPQTIKSFVGEQNSNPNESNIDRVRLGRLLTKLGAPEIVRNEFRP